jgi:hypothetical protein
MKKLSKIAAAASLVAGMGMPMAAHAILIDGIEVGTGGNFKFVASTIMEQKTGGGLITAVGDTLEGVGQVTQIFDGANLVWSNGQNGRELTFAFSGYTASNVAASHITFTGGIVNFFSDSSPDANFGAATGFTDGNNWLDLAGTSFFDPITASNATLVSDGTLLGPSISGTGIGALSVTGGLAGAFFDTNRVGPLLGTGNIADFEINSSFNNQPSPFAYGTHGTANISQPAAAPEPASLALVGIALLGMAGAARKSKKR